ncbi:hypothetical protein [Mucilaginibacter polytrichastri]|uniref:Uncharacterized protein n=1 Tax=Mucilaginibacter polytrichastri TaxID=1302689 RepID=A0A1Q5ZUT7_9SPHI|nr:hypothetical protein [Mucilaginibacter polytrichastri]OKS85542.1 hypothetical protein RG47T_0988 [Mucilaginibacter polytrichastri]SFS36958.1 hypothetical protein SAMN04487890_101112 [Mucilaginibacter polytrichastri]
MKKFLFFAVLILTISFTGCTKDNSVEPTTTQTKKLADDGNKQDLGQADGNKQDLGQADAK